MKITSPWAVSSSNKTLLAAAVSAALFGSSMVNAAAKNQRRIQDEA